MLSSRAAAPKIADHVPTHRRVPRRRFGLVLGVLAAVALGGCDNGEVTETTGTGSMRLGTAGGVVTSTDGLVSVSFPVGALRAEDLIVIEPLAPADAASRPYRVGPVEVALSADATVTFDLTLVQDAELSRVRVARLDESGSWQPLARQVLDTDGLRVAGDTDSMGTFALIEAGCASTDDCTDGLQCITGTCRAFTCSNDGDCPPTAICADGGCEEAVSCEEDPTSCPEGDLCDNVVCRPAPTCESSDDCTDSICRDGICVLPPDCSDDSDCLEAEICSGGTCAPRIECDATAEQPCGAGKCLEGVCRQVECVDDGDCGGGRPCVDNVCSESTNACETDDDCHNGRACNNGICGG